MYTGNSFLEKKDLYSTSDLALAAAISIYYPVIKIDKKNPKKVFFIFQKDKNLEDLIEKYWRGDLRLEPKQYFNCLKNLKNRLYSS